MKRPLVLLMVVTLSSCRPGTRPSEFLESIERIRYLQQGDTSVSLHITESFGYSKPITDTTLQEKHSKDGLVIRNFEYGISDGDTSLFAHSYSDYDEAGRKTSQIDSLFGRLERHYQFFYGNGQLIRKASISLIPRYNMRKPDPMPMGYDSILTESRLYYEDQGLLKMELIHQETRHFGAPKIDAAIDTLIRYYTHNPEGLESSIVTLEQMDTMAVTSKEYDSEGRLLFEKFYSGELGSGRKSFTYDSVGNQIMETMVSPHIKERIETTFDLKNRPVEIKVYGLLQ